LLLLGRGQVSNGIARGPCLRFVFFLGFKPGGPFHSRAVSGAIHFIRVGINPLTSINPQMGALGMPFLYRDRAHMFKVLDGPIGQEIMESLQRQNLLGLCWFDAGFRNFYNSQREIRSPADMAGLKIRVQESPLMMDMIRFCGASPTPMAYGEVYTGIQNGVIDGAENNWPS
jgi:TRAP-type C4-dicarboxylate transport system substrate-binding protein